MKKLLVLLTLMVGLLGFAAGASAQVCTSCSGTDVRNVPCTLTDQGSCYAFDYDGYNATGVGSYDGYCASTKDTYKALFNICECPDPNNNFIKGASISIRMTILVNGAEGANGAYWSAYAGTTLDFSAFAETAHTAACEYDSYDYGFPNSNYFKADGTTPVTTLTSSTTCTVPAASQATVLTAGPLTQDTLGYLIDERLCLWWLDIRPIRIDPGVLHNGETISVKIEIIADTGGICALGNVICDCVIDVAKACCTTVTSGHLLFPYFTDYVGSDYWNGIAIVNTSSKSGTATLTAYEQDGSVGTATVTVDAKSMFVSLLENISWTGTDLGNSPCYISVVTDFSADGFAMLANENHDSMGYLPRQ